MHSLIWFIPTFAVVTTGLLAGVMLGVAMEQHTARALPGDCWIVRQNLNNHLFRLVMPIAFVITNASVCWSLFLFRGSARLWTTGAIVSSLGVVLVTIVFEVPLNNLMATWGPGQLPSDWARTGDAWLRNHWWRTFLGVVAFVCSTVAGRLATR